MSIVIALSGLEQKTSARQLLRVCKVVGPPQIVQALKQEHLQFLFVLN